MTTEITTELRIKALAAYLECDTDDLTEGHSETVIECGSKEYLVVSDDEADTALIDNVTESAWAFTPSFLASYCDLPEEVFTAMQDKCEDSNDAILKCITRAGSIEDFAHEAESADGRGHFLSGYDGNENEQTIEDEDHNKVTFYIYRQN